MACGILVPQPGIEPRASAVEVWGPNHGTAREFPLSGDLKQGCKLTKFKGTFCQISAACAHSLMGISSPPLGVSAAPLLFLGCSQFRPE